MTKSSATMTKFISPKITDLADGLDQAFDRQEPELARVYTLAIYRSLPVSLQRTYAEVAMSLHGCTAAEIGHALAVTPRAALIRLQKLERLGLLMRITIKPGQHNGARLRFAARSSILDRERDS